MYTAPLSEKSVDDPKQQIMMSNNVMPNPKFQFNIDQPIAFELKNKTTSMFKRGINEQQQIRRMRKRSINEINKKLQLADGMSKTHKRLPSTLIFASPDNNLNLPQLSTKHMQSNVYPTSPDHLNTAQSGMSPLKMPYGSKSFNYTTRAGGPQTQQSNAKNQISFKQASQIYNEKQAADY